MTMRNVMTGFVAMSMVAASQMSTAGEASPIVKLRTLSHTIANQIALVAVNDCTKRGYKVAAAVVGRDGHLLSLVRNPLSGPHTVEVSQRKAFSSATFQASTEEMKSRDDLRFAPGVLLIRGGVPISVGGHFYGAVAVSGALPEVDEECSLEGIAAVVDAIEFAE